MNRIFVLSVNNLYFIIIYLLFITVKNYLQRFTSENVFLKVYNSDQIISVGLTATSPQIKIVSDGCMHE